jgi:hypothetical protein
MTAAELITSVEVAGGRVWLQDESVRYRLPRVAERLLPELRAHQNQIFQLLTEREQVMFLPVPCTCAEKPYPHFRHRDGSGPGSGHEMKP